MKKNKAETKAILTLSCGFCHKEFNRLKCRTKGRQVLFCSSECHLKFLQANTKTSICPVCKKEIKRKFSEAKDIEISCCSRACRGEFLKTHYTGTNNPNYKHSPLELILTNRLKGAKTRAEEKKLPFNLTVEYLLKLFNEQGGQCYYSGLPLEVMSKYWDGEADLNVMSIDRVKPELGYVEGNVVFCCNGINKLKGGHPVGGVYEFLNYLVANVQEKCFVKVKKFSESAREPLRANIGDVGYDLYVDRVENLDDNRIKVYYGIGVQAASGWYFELAPRSSIHKWGLVMANGFGIIDNGYQGELASVFYKLDNFVEPKAGERITQLIPHRYAIAQFEVVKDFDTKSERGENGFGSTGKTDFNIQTVSKAI